MSGTKHLNVEVGHCSVCGHYGKSCEGVLHEISLATFVGIIAAQLKSGYSPAEAASILLSEGYPESIVYDESVRKEP